MSNISSREFNQNSTRAKKAAADGPVFITDRGLPTHVLLTIDEYRKLSRTGKSLAEALAMPGGDDFEFEIPRLSDDMGLRIPDFED